MLFFPKFTKRDTLDFVGYLSLYQQRPLIISIWGFCLLKYEKHCFIKPIQQIGIEEIFTYITLSILYTLNNEKTSKTSLAESVWKFHKIQMWELLSSKWNLRLQIRIYFYNSAHR